MLVLALARTDLFISSQEPAECIQPAACARRQAARPDSSLSQSSALDATHTHREKEKKTHRIAKRERVCNDNCAAQIRSHQFRS
jgi:hypothetical protein